MAKKASIKSIAVVVSEALVEGHVDKEGNPDCFLMEFLMMTNFGKTIFGRLVGDVKILEVEECEYPYVAVAQFVEEKEVVAND